MLRDEYFRRLVDNAHLQLYLSANDGARLYWPWRMQPPKEASRSYRDACERYIIDSDPKDNTVTTKDVLDTAFRLNADVASLQDVYQDKDATVGKLLAGLETYDDHSFDGELLLPLQEPFIECWNEIGEPKVHLLGIGGLKDASPQKRVEATRTLREAVGQDVWIHGFGWGVKGLKQPIQNNPELLDSIDYSTPVQSGSDPTVSSGKERMSVVAMNAATQLIEDLRDVSSYVDQTPEDFRDTGQQGMDAFQRP